MLTVKNVSSGYVKNNVLSDVSFHVNEGEIVSLIGPNGAGKSTALKTVFGFLETSGSVIFNGKDITRKKPHQLAKLGMCFVHQGRQVFRNMNVEENLLLGAFTNKKKTDGINPLWRAAAAACNRQGIDAFSKADFT